MAFTVPIVGCKVACKGWQCICDLRHDKTNIAPELSYLVILAVTISIDAGLFA